MDTSIDPAVAAGVHAAIAAYAQAVDAGRTDDIVELFCSDGIVDIAGSGVFEGRHAIRAAYAGWVPRHPQLHLVANTVITSWTEHEATAISDLVVFGRGASSGWGMRLVGRYEDTLHQHDRQWRFWRRVTTFTP